jgi:hypothetical protein
MTVRCEECGKDVRGRMSPWNHWHRLACLLEFLLDEQLIEEATYAKALDSLLYFKGYAVEQEERQDG